MKAGSIFHNDKILNAITIGLIVVGIVCIGYVLFNFISRRSDQAKIGNLDCVKETSTVKIADSHMAGIFNEGDAVNVMMNFYNCNEPKKGEYALYRFSSQIAPVVRVVRGVPGDQYDLVQDATDKSKWLVRINQQPLMAGSEPYYVKSNSIPPLKTYSESRKGRLLGDEYILLSNVPPGLSDSSNLGLIKRAELIGKVVK